MPTIPATAPTRKPFCYICSADREAVFHEHSSSREIRIVQGVEYETENRPYMCTTCMTVHLARLDVSLNVYVGTSQLHNLHTPKDTSRAHMDSDPFHIEWLTVCDATITQLEYAWIRDYDKQPRAMRILLSAGLEDLAMGRSVSHVIHSFMHFKQVVDEQNVKHPEHKNELVIATVFNPPAFVWFQDNGNPPRNHRNMLDAIRELNTWIVFYNKQNGKETTPRFHRFGVRDGWTFNLEGRKVRVKKHIMAQWTSEPILTRVHLIDQVRIKVGVAVTRHFKGEEERFGKLG